MTSLLLLALLSTTKGYPAHFVNCYDGDTCTFVIDLSLGVQKTEDVRICDIDTPEMRGTTKTQAEAARLHVTRLIVAAETVMLQVPQKTRCKDTNRCEQRSFTRLLAWVIVDGKVLGDLMVRDGYAKVADESCGVRQ